jgi:uncharacterized SAM-binding protein YcdF (DUF218 family)
VSGDLTPQIQKICIIKEMIHLRGGRILKSRKKIWFILCIFTLFGLVYIGILQSKISQYASQTVPEKADYMIILGAKVKNSGPSLVLKYRINTAVSYLRKNEKTIVIASGGKGSNEPISEAESIKQGLISKGIPKTQIFLEDQSTSTYENIRNSKKFIPPSAKNGIIVTNDFHIYRSLQIAKDQGLTLYGLPAKTPLSAIPKSYFHEYLAITKYYLEKYILK